MDVSRYWSVYMNAYLTKYGNNETTFQLAFGSEYSLEKLQLEYDQFFIRALQQIFSAHRYAIENLSIQEMVRGLACYIELWMGARGCWENTWDIG